MKALKFSVLATAGVLLAGCSNDDYKFNSEWYEQNQKELFAQHFVKEFGEIPSNQNWDFAGSPLISIDGQQTRSTRATVHQTCTPDKQYPYLDENGYFDIPASMQTSMNDIKENVNNSSLGCTYAMSVPDNSFSIIPVRQGYTASTYEVHMVVGSGADAVDYLLWKKGQMMQTRKAESTETWKNVTTGEKSFTYGNFDVRSQVLTFTDMPVDEPMYFYIYRPTTGLYPSSLDGYMKDFTSVVDMPQQLIEDGKHVRLIGAEAQMSDNGADFDYEDVMFLIVGDPTLPGDITPLDKLKFSQTVSKRYMIEDLGETDDTDFNDIVVDVQASRSISFDYNPSTGEITNRVYGNWENQTATLRHLGGVLAFNLTIGETELGWMSGNMDASPNNHFAVSGWDPDRNNISIQVQQKEESDGVSSIQFPTEGSVPLIIATSTSQPWMEERVSIIPALKELIIEVGKE